MTALSSNKVLSVEFHLSIDANEYLKYYSGQIRWVIAISSQGLKVRFPANLLTPFVSQNGIKGQFVLEYLTNGKVVALKKLNTNDASRH